ncbi:MAG: tRNA (N6-threonylcarbamoyladenosine(37)-N6)-methyltransferase TrmO [candidate division Zixibacteria bacterium]|nr:tRNA (N6-threonylcarbamoyladenosine(37)-N6)-methyltransferase TrmO [candidate division Zixibacteria bacterium]
MEDFKFEPIGYIECPQLKTIDDIYDRKKREKIKAKVVLNDKFEEALEDIETFDYIWLIFIFNRNIGKGYKTKFKPRPDPSAERGLFLTRSPYRPNPIGLSCVKLLGHEKNILYFENSDIIDSTPLLDIKPYIPNSDSHPNLRAGWLDKLK